MDSTEYLIIPCVEVRQPIGSFFISSMKAKDLVRISHADVRELREGKDELRKYVGIQRELTPSRVKKLKQYVTTADATFPTAIILAIRTYPDLEQDEQSIEQLPNIFFDKKDGTLNILNDENVAKIIDGQHRIEGLVGIDNPNFEVNVAIFVDMTIEYQALVFATINLQQTKVSKSLAYDLLEYERHRSPQKTCHEIVKLLDTSEDSPFKEKIKVLGKAEGPDETITQATFIDRLIAYLTEDQVDDRDKYIRGKKPARADAERSKRMIFRNLFLDEQDAVIARILWNYFAAVRTKWNRAWNQVERGNVLNRTTGFGALMRFLRLAYIALEKDGHGIVSEKSFSKVFARITLKDEDFNPENFKPGSSGEGLLFRTFKEHTKLS